MIIDHADHLELQEKAVARFGNELRSLKYLSGGLWFLYNQVRNMVGTLIEIGRGHWEPQIIDEIFSSGERSRAGPMVPPRGLCLQWVRYDMTRLQASQTQREERSRSARAGPLPQIPDEAP